MTALLFRDLKLAVRAGGGAMIGVLFFMTVVAVIPFGVGPDLNLLARIGPAILWIGALLASLRTEDPQVFAVLSTQLQDTDKMVGNWRLANDARVKDAFWAELQSALLGRKPARQAMADAERRVARELRRS